MTPNAPTRTLRLVFAWLPWLVLGALALDAALRLLLPYVAENALEGGDHPGHLFLARFFREYLAPWPTGWNGRLWLGFPQDELYPPLVHVATGLLGGLVGDAAALKALVLLALLALFPAAFALGRAFGLDRAGAAGLAALLWALGFLSARHLGTDFAYGANLESTFSAGMVVATVGWPLLLLSLALLAPAPPDPERLALAPAAVLALTLLTHFVAGLFAVLFLGCRVVVALVAAPAERRAVLRWYGGTGALALSLAAFWLLPLLLASGQIAADPIGLRWTWPEATSLVLPTLLAAAAAFLRRTPAALAWGAFTMVGALGTVFVDRAEVATHAYRFLPAVWLGGVVALALLLRRGWALALLAGGAVLALAPGARLHPRGNPPLAVAATLPGARALVAVPEGHASGYEALPHALAAAGGMVSHGISVESAATNRAIFNVLQELHEDIPIWSVYPPAAPPLDGDAGRAGRLLRKLRHLGFTHVVTDLRLERLLGPAASAVRAGEVVASYPALLAAPGAAADVRLERGEYRFVPYALPPVPLVTALDALPEVVPPEVFAAAAEYHWLQGDPTHVVVDAPLPSDAVPAPSALGIDAVQVTPSGDGLRFQVPSVHPVPLLVRIAWHPGWRATADDVAVPVLRASPALLLVVARGDVVLQWERGPVAGVAAGVSALAWLGLVVAAVRRARRRQRANTTTAPDVVPTQS